MAFEIHWHNDACFEPCPTKTFINNFKVGDKNLAPNSISAFDGETLVSDRIHIILFLINCLIFNLPRQ